MSFNTLVSVCVHRNVDPLCWDSLWTLSFCPDPRMVVKFNHGDALIERSRAIVATRFMEAKDYDVLMFIDDDIVFNPLHAANIARLVYEDGLDIVGGAYVKKQEVGTSFAIKSLDDKPIPFGPVMENGAGAVSEVRMVSTGFMAIHRRVFQKMIDEEVVHLCHPQNFKFYPFFKTEEAQVDGQWIHLSEDWAFCERARRLGFRVWVDGNAKLQHVGPYKYDWDDIMRPPKTKTEMLKYWEENCNPRAQVIQKKPTILTYPSDKGVEGSYQLPQGEIRHG